MDQVARRLGKFEPAISVHQNWDGPPHVLPAAEDAKFCSTTMVDASNWAGSAGIGDGASAGSMRKSVGGVSMPSTVTNARSDVPAAALRWTVDLSGIRPEP